MARKLKEGPQVTPAQVDPDVIKKAVAGVKETKADLSKAQMANASEWKEVKRKGIHDQALKLAVRLDEMEETQRLAFLSWFDRIRGVLCLDRTDQGDLFDDDTVTDQQIREAADTLRTTSNDQQESVAANEPAKIEPATDAPLPFEAAYKSKPRLIRAARKGAADAREGNAFSPDQFNGDVMRQAYTDGYNQQAIALNRSVEAEPEAAVEEVVTVPAPAPVAEVIETAPAGSDPTPEELEAAYQEGRTAFDLGKAPGAHPYPDKPRLAKYFQNGWASRQQEVNTAREVEKQAAKSGSDTSRERPLSGWKSCARGADSETAVRYEAEHAHQHGYGRTDCPYEPGSWQWETWTKRFDQIDNDTFEAAAAPPKRNGRAGAVEMPAV